MQNEMQTTATENLQLSLPQNEALSMYNTASTLQLTKEESEKMSSIFDDELIEIRPDGHIYLPQSYYRNRLNETVGIGQWGLIPKGSHQETTATQAGNKVKLFLNGILVIRGCFVAEAVGEAEYHTTNPNQSIATVWESAKSDCITRCCKDLSIAKQIYEPTFIRRWQEQYAIKVWVEDIKKPQWRKKTSEPFLKEKGPVEASKPYPFQHPDRVLRWLNEKTQAGGVTGDWLKVTEALKNGTTTIAEVSKEYKVSKAVEEKLLAIVEDAKKVASGNIQGKWYAMLEKCTTKLDVDQLSIQYMEDVKANPALYKLFQDTKTKLPSAKTA